MSAIKLDNSFWQYMCLARGVTGASLLFAVAVLPVSHATVPGHADALLQIDANRTAVVDRITSNWGTELSPWQLPSLRKQLMGLRADQLMAANLSGTFDGVLEILDQHRTPSGTQGLARTAVPVTSLQYRGEMQKSLGQSELDLVYTPIMPCNLMDTRSGVTPPPPEGGPRLESGYAVRTVQVSGRCNIPSTAKAIAGLFTIENLPSTGGVIFAGPGTGATSVVVSWAAPVTYASGSSVVPLTSLGAMQIQSANITEIKIDINGYFTTPDRNGDGLRVTNLNAISPNMIGGSAANTLRAGVRGATIAGGGVAALGDPDYGGDAPNLVTDHYGFIGGGTSNQAGNDNADVADAGFTAVVGGRGNRALGSFSFIGGGVDNLAQGYIGSVASGEANRSLDAWTFVGGGKQNTAGSSLAFVGGGSSNTASGTAAAVVGGQSNSASGVTAFIGGGDSNNASGSYSAVLGGFSNSASGPTSLAAGTKARSPFAGCFTWGDSLSDDVSCVAADQFVARARGGVQFITAGVNGTYSGVQLASGAGAWSTLSDRSAKSDIRSVDPKDILRRVLQMPIATWKYKSEPGQVLHMGPMAQDFFKIFRLGASERSITTVDADGVALAAIQGLHQIIREKDLKIQQLERDISAIKKALGL